MFWIRYESNLRRIKKADEIDRVLDQTITLRSTERDGYNRRAYRKLDGRFKVNVTRIDRASEAILPSQHLVLQTTT